MASKSKSKQEEALQFLDDLDSLNPVAQTTRGPAANTGSAGDPADVLAFIDEITQKSSEPTRSTTSHIERHASRPGTPSLRKSTERVKVGAHPSSSTTSLVAKPEPSSAPAAKAEAEPALTPSSSRWGWGSVWTSANTAYQQARSVVDEQVKNLPKNEHISKLGEGVLEYAKTAQLDKLGSSAHDELIRCQLIRTF